MFLKFFFNSYGAPLLYKNLQYNHVRSLLAGSLLAGSVFLLACFVATLGSTHNAVILCVLWSVSVVHIELLIFELWIVNCQFSKICFARNVWNWGSGVCVHTIFLRIFVAKCRFMLCFWNFSSTATEPHKIWFFHCSTSIIECQKILKNLFCTKRMKSRWGVCVHTIFLRIFVEKCRFLSIFKKFLQQIRRLTKCDFFNFHSQLSIFKNLFCTKRMKSSCGVCVHTIYLRIFVAKCRFLLIF